MNVYLIIILTVLVGKYILDTTVERLNIQNLNPELPEEFREYYDEKKYAKSQEYTREYSRFGLVQHSLNITVIIPFILFGGFNFIDQIVRDFYFNPIITGILYIFILIVLSGMIGLPFDIYKTFVIEEKYGFNKTSIGTFIFDILKGLLLLIIIGGPLFYAVLWFFEKTGDLAPLYVWILITLFEIFITFIAPVVIMPIFNKFTPLEDGELKRKIETYATEHDFKMKGVYTMDGSKRSAKSNAFFTGFGKSRRIVLFDTLIKKHTADELVSVLAHEMGHYKLKHIPKMLIFSTLEKGLILFILSLFLNNRELFNAFRMEELSIYSSLIFFGFLYAPISMLLSILINKLSRTYEYEADKYSFDTTEKGDIFVSALKKLSVDNLSNLTPHPLKVFLHYTHPPVLNRIEAIRKKVSGSHK